MVGSRVMSEITLAIHHDHLGVDVLWPVLELKVGRPVCMNGGRTGRIGERVSFSIFRLRIGQVRNSDLPFERDPRWCWRRRGRKRKQCGSSEEGVCRAHAEEVECVGWRRLCDLNSLVLYRLSSQSRSGMNLDELSRLKFLRYLPTLPYLCVTVRDQRGSGVTK
jgi:hypothetical protein